MTFNLGCGHYKDYKEQESLILWGIIGGFIMRYSI